MLGLFAESRPRVYLIKVQDLTPKPCMINGKECAVMSSFDPQQFNFEKETVRTQQGRKIEERKRVRFDAEDIIAFFAGIIAVVFAFGIVFGEIPINPLTIGVLGFSGVGAVIAKIIKVRNRTRQNEKEEKEVKKT